MNEQTAALLQNLATKIGTTSEYLWAVMVKQAPISSVLYMVELAVFVSICLLLYRFKANVGAFLKHWFETEEVTAFIFSLIAIATLFVIVMSFLFGIGGAVTGALNPEYWALKEVLSAVKSK